MHTQLVENHLGQVRALACQLKERFRVPFEVDELVAYGVQGLLEAAERYNPDAGTAFFSFAFQRVRGAMCDGMRQMGWLSRREYERYRAEVAAQAYLEGLAFEEAEAEASGSGGEESIERTLEEVSQALAGVAAIFVSSLDSEHIPDDCMHTSELGAEAQLLAHERRIRVYEAIARLPERERRLLALYYLEGKTLDEAGEALSLSKSWASRLHTRAVNLLRAELEDAQEEARWAEADSRSRVCA